MHLDVGEARAHDGRDAVPGSREAACFGGGGRSRKVEIGILMLSLADEALVKPLRDAPAKPSTSRSSSRLFPSSASLIRRISSSLPSPSLHV
ncbi:hypothetical protein BD626DRAFT_566267 [Schizophyllum amplum]|uniref:Uncharacterized protein n=1 Tax=Schizophyllum amplum TaxID=97359 RepID=A0A550CR25_9AGAR|nr:hypothetical protein BD626DRAFT_566267 [Auriculariopsis ampla]